MEETFFEMLERTRAVDRLLFWLAVLSPLVVAGFAAWLRHRPMVTRHRHRWVLACLAAPALLVLWKVYNAVVDKYGLDSLFALFVNVGVFAAAAMLATGLRLVLRAVLSDIPRTEASAATSAQPAGEFRPYTPALGTADTTTGYSARVSGPANITDNKE